MALSARTASVSFTLFRGTRTVRWWAKQSAATSATGTSVRVTPAVVVAGGAAVAKQGGKRRSVVLRGRAAAEGLAPPALPPLHLDGRDPVALADPPHRLCRLDPQRPTAEHALRLRPGESTHPVAKGTR